MKSKTLWMLGLLLAGCYEDQPDPLPYPPLDARALVGCWQEVVPAGECSSECFDRNGGYFHSSTFNYRDTELREDSGDFRTDLNSLLLNRIVRTTLGKDDPSDDGLRLTMINDSLKGVQPLGGVIFARVHPDSFPCGLKPWTLFQKPPGWDTLIIPYDR